jgi:hypothetical protein
MIFTTIMKINFQFGSKSPNGKMNTFLSPDIKRIPSKMKIIFQIGSLFLSFGKK